jgi:hypothetical protein
LIPRLFIIETRFSSRENIRSGGLDLFFSSGGGFGLMIEKYKLIYHGLLVQEEGTTILHLIPPGDKIVFVKGYEEYCRWHNGPLEKRDNPFEREYCTREATSELGYCNVHRNSLRAIYTKCFGSSGLDSLRSCWILDEKLKDGVEYVVYMLAYSTNKFKVGSTRMWRLHDRIGEQPHVVATILYRSRSAVKTREIEIKAGRIEGLTEHPRRKLADTISTPIPPTTLRLKRVLEKTARILGLKNPESKFFRVEPAHGVEEFYRANEVKLDNLLGKPLILKDYYAGYMLLEEPNTNTRYLVKGNSILHVNSVKLVS